MQAKELLSAQYSLLFYSSIMCKCLKSQPHVSVYNLNLDPVSLFIICVSLGFALNPKFRLLPGRILGKLRNAGSSKNRSKDSRRGMGGSGANGKVDIEEVR